MEVNGDNIELSEGGTQFNTNRTVRRYERGGGDKIVDTSVPA